MTDVRDERLSALLDGELDNDEARAAWQELHQDSDHQQRWTRYELIGDTLRNNLPEQLPLNLAARISDALEDEPPLLAPTGEDVLQAAPPKKRLTARIWQPVAGLAVAASVAVVAVIGLQHQAGQEFPGGLTGSQVAENASADALKARTPGTHWQNVNEPEVAKRLNRYLVGHHGSAPANSLKGMLPYVTVVGYDADRD